MILGSARVHPTMAGTTRLAPYLFPLLIVAYWPLLLVADAHVSQNEQYLLGLATLALLVAATRGSSATERRQVWLLVLVATAAEVLLSVVWGVYRYRYGNVPALRPVRARPGLSFRASNRPDALRPLARAALRARGADVRRRVAAGRPHRPAVRDRANRPAGARRAPRLHLGSPQAFGSDVHGRVLRDRRARAARDRTGKLDLVRSGPRHVGPCRQPARAGSRRLLPHRALGTACRTPALGPRKSDARAAPAAHVRTGSRLSRPLSPRPEQRTDAGSRRGAASGARACHHAPFGQTRRSRPLSH